MPIRQQPCDIPEPKRNPDAYKSPEVLQDLYVTRGWRRRDIAEYFDIAGHEVVALLEEHEIQRERKYSSAPTNGLAKELWEHGRKQAINAGDGQ